MSEATGLPSFVCIIADQTKKSNYTVSTYNLWHFLYWIWDSTDDE